MSSSALGTFLRARRDALSPETVGLVSDSTRRVRGLRRPEVASLAGISSEYYLRLEQGKDRQPSGQVLASLARALQLDADGVEYLFRLAGQTPPLGTGDGVSPRSGVGRGRDFDTEMALVLEQWAMNPAYVSDSNFFVLGINELGRELVPYLTGPRVNIVEQVVEGALAAPPSDQEFWDEAASAFIMALRYWSNPDDPELQLLVASLSSKSRLFRDVWNSHEARPLRGGRVAIDVPPFGYISFRWQSFEVPGKSAFLTMWGDPGEAPTSAVIDYLRAKVKVRRALEDSPVERPTLDELTTLDSARMKTATRTA